MIEIHHWKYHAELTYVYSLIKILNTICVLLRWRISFRISTIDFVIDTEQRINVSQMRLKIKKEEKKIDRKTEFPTSLLSTRSFQSTVS